SGKGKGWVDYKWPNPATKILEAKSSYVERYEDVYVGCGIYKK
ncbi:MAG TPA: histidine kinase, partial [Oxalobacteraceae bacterium]|nr:histidine kinase [Oxalobacteraceae bacterium]